MGANAASPGQTQSLETGFAKLAKFSIHTTARGIGSPASQPPKQLEANVREVKRLTLEVDFGQDQDVGDRVIWAGARLLRAEVGR